MKLKALLVAMLAAGIATSIALASPPSDRGREGQTGVTPTTKTSTERGPKSQREGDRRREARPVVMLVLHGEFVSASEGSFAMLVKHANKHARALRGKQVTVKVDGKTKFRRQGKAALADLLAGDRLHVLVRARKNADAGTLELLARLVQARPARAERDDEDDEDETGTTATTSNTNTGTTTSAD
jgi:hypothetical protein